MNVFEIIFAATVSICVITFFLFVVVPLAIMGSVALYVSITDKFDEMKLNRLKKRLRKHGRVSKAEIHGTPLTRTEIIKLYDEKCRLYKPTETKQEEHQ